MPLRRSDLADFAYFMAIAKYRSFRRASADMGVTTSALSHSMTALEARLGVRLLNRTTRSVTLTAAGEELHAAIVNPLETIGQAVENLSRFRDAPAGRVRISVPEDAVSTLLDPVMPVFVDRYPDVELDISINNRLIDVTEGGFDAGIRWGGTVPEDMVAQRLSADIRWVACASPAYLERFGLPEHPDDLRNHRCVRFRLGDGQIYHWEFERGDEAVTVPTPGPVTVDAGHAALSFGLSGVGVIYAAEPIVQAHLDSGHLKLVLAEWTSMGSAFHAYYSSRRHVPAGLRLLIELIREIKPLSM